MFLFHLWLVDFEETISLNSEVAYLDYYLKILMLNASTVIGKKCADTRCTYSCSLQSYFITFLMKCIAKKLTVTFLMV